MEGVRILEVRHMTAILLHLLEHGGSATRMSLYNSIANNDRMPDKFGLLEAAGLVVQTRDRFTRAVTLTLTERGREAAEMLRDLDSLIREGQGACEEGSEASVGS